MGDEGKKKKKKRTRSPDAKDPEKHCLWHPHGKSFNNFADLKGARICTACNHSITRTDGKFNSLWNMEETPAELAQALFPGGYCIQCQNTGRWKELTSDQIRGSYFQVHHLCILRLLSNAEELQRIKDHLEGCNENYPTIKWRRENVIEKLPQFIAYKLADKKENQNLLREIPFGDYTRIMCGIPMANHQATNYGSLPDAEMSQETLTGSRANSAPPKDVLILRPLGPSGTGDAHTIFSIPSASHQVTHDVDQRSHTSVDWRTIQPSPLFLNGPDHPIRVVLLGLSGSGKSALGNTMLGFNAFETSNYASACTRECNQFDTIIDEISLRFIDTPGADDAHQLQMVSWGQTARILTHGVNVRFLWVTSGKVTRTEVCALIMLHHQVFDQRLMDNLTIVRSNFDEYEKDQSCRDDIRELQEIPYLRPVMQKVMVDKIVHINNHPRFEDDRRKAKEKVKRQLIPPVAENTWTFIVPS